MVHSHIKPRTMPVVLYYMKAKQNSCISTTSFTFYKIVKMMVFACPQIAWSLHQVSFKSVCWIVSGKDHKLTT